MRVGWGFDAHRFDGNPPVLLAGIAADHARGLAGTSDADVVAHAVADALLGAAGLGDLGVLFPSSDPRWSGADSMALLRQVVERFYGEGLAVDHIDVTVIAETIRIEPVREDIRRNLAAALGVNSRSVSIKATSTDGLGFLGRDEGVAAVAVVTTT